MESASNFVISPMIHLNNIHSLTEFQRNAREFAVRAKQTKKPLVITVNGKAELVVQDAQSYQELLDRLKYLETITAIGKAKGG